MAHPNRSRAKANERRRRLAAFKQRAVPPETQAEIARHNLARRVGRYPFAPTYECGYRPQKRVRLPRVLDFGGEPFFILLARMALRRGVAKIQSRRKTAA